MRSRPRCLSHSASRFHVVDLAKPHLLEPVALLGAGPIGLLILQVLKVAGAGEAHVIEPLTHRRAAALGLGAKAEFPTADEFVSGPGKGGRQTHGPE